MATLLTFLLHHISKAGVGWAFKTHLAGAKKLMRMRSVGRETQKRGWVETVFTWSGNMSALVDNREAQLGGGDERDQDSLPDCDRGLFMGLVGLGRSNTGMLSQIALSAASNRPEIENDGETGL
ncbi:unnamed protein product [Tuber aestivum]|uniref:Uncharacterized protein n=1 Tax=Tuber aestivum TaxID=59557 RepID=A0A292Q406_9PEZI|nr:unnamed protein product [Tuber aestivum]